MDKTNMLPLQMECTLFFQENPYTLETLAGLALRLGRKPEDIRPALQHLVSLSILEEIGEGERAIYRYNHPVVTSEVGIVWEQV
ncbi:hypothetical protein [Effusibacillus consociatus]|uniref:ArsR family transcriptional regulator n=1 Tax=Effusibacillus consociatus TaxID=1117041 RepID=A0ABV9Q1C4_9BACL